MAILNKIPLFRFAAFALLGVGLGGAAFIFLRNQDLPRISVSSREIDFGRVSPGGLAQRTVIIRNTGRLPLHIQNVKLSCSCTRATLQKSVISAGEHAELLLSIEGTPVRRETSAEVALLTNDPKTPVLELALRFSTLDDIWVEPASIDFGQVARESLPQSKSFRIHFSPESSVQSNLPRIRMEDEHFKAVIKSSDEPRIVDVQVELLPSAPSGQHRTSVGLLSKDDSISISLDVHANIRGDAFAMPPAIVLGPLGDEGEGEIMQSITVRRRDGRAANLRVQLPPQLANILDVTEKASGVLDVRLRSSNSIHSMVTGSIVIEVFGDELVHELVSIPVTLIWKSERL